LGFDWVQHIEIFPGFILTSSGLITALPSFNDPAPSGYTYCPTRGGGYNYDGWSFYYNPDLSLPVADPWALPAHIIKTDFSESLAFFDAPQALIILLSPFAFMGFTTELVGIIHCDTPGTDQCSSSELGPSAPLYTFSWTDNYSGLTGGITTP
jgi:hypothetical protein